MIRPCSATAARPAGKPRASGDDPQGRLWNAPTKW